MFRAIESNTPWIWKFLFIAALFYLLFDSKSTISKRFSLFFAWRYNAIVTYMQLNNVKLLVYFNGEMSIDLRKFQMLYILTLVFKQKL